MAQAGVTPEQARPNAMALCYPVITAGEKAHRGSFIALTGSEDTSDHLPYSLEDHVSPATPPTFLWHTWQDGAVPVENTLLMAQALKAAGGQAEVHIYPFGGHGLAMADETTAALIREYKKLQVKLQMGAMAGTKPDDDDMQRFQGITSLLFSNPTVSKYMLAEMRLQQALADIFKIITEAANIDMGLPGLDN